MEIENKKFVIYGAGGSLKALWGGCKNLNPICIADQKYDLIGSRFEGIKIVSPNEIPSYQFDSILITNRRENDVEEIRHCLTDMGINDDQILSLYSWTVRNHFCIPGLVVSVGQKCTLKCKNCGNFSPYASQEHLEYDVFDIIREINSFLDTVDFITEIQIQGGEPFLYKDLEKLVEFTLNEKRILHVTIASNGTIIPPDKIISLCKNPKVTIRISDYSIPGKKQVLKNYLNNNGINYFCYNFSDNNDKWRDLGGIDTIRENDDSIVEKRFMNCNFQYCLTLENAMLGWCSRSTHAPFIQKFPISDEDIFKFEADGTADCKKLREYLSEHKFMETCRYCHGTDGEAIQPAIQIQ